MSVSVCKFYTLNRKCAFGKNCRYLHSTSQGPPILLDFKKENNGHLEDSSYPPASVDLISIKPDQQSSRNIQNEGVKLTDLFGKNLQLQDQADKSQAQQSVEIIHENLSKQRPKNICYYFKTHGNCRYGNECKFSHILSENEHGYKTSKSKQQRHLGKFADVPPRFRKTEDQDEEFSAASTTLLAHDDMRRRYTETHQQYKGGNRIYGSSGNIYAETRRVCRFFISGNCSKGDYCKFIHPSNYISEEATLKFKPRKLEYKSNKIQVDNHNSTSAQTDDNKIHGRTHSGHRDQLTKNAPSQQFLIKKIFTYAELENTDIRKLRDSEINTIKKRFPQDKINVVEDTDSKFVAIILFSPTDPDWMFDVHVFELQISVPSGYPREMMNIVLPMDQNLPETVRRYVEISIQEWLSNKTEQLAADSKVELVFRPFLMWLDRNIEDITTEALKQFKRELVAKAAGMEFIPAGKLQAKFKAQSQNSTEEDNVIPEHDGIHKVDNYGSEGSSDSSVDDFDDQVLKQELNVDPEKKGTEIELRQLQLLENSAALMFEKLKLVLQCGRCKNHSDILVSPGKVMSIKCEKCSQGQFVHFRAALIHQFSSVVGYLDVDGCQAFDLIFQECRVAVTCMSCSKQTRINGLVSGHVVDAWCQACNARFKLATEAVKFVQLVPSGIDTTVNKVVEVASSKQKRPPKDAAIREGYPLPEFGTCKHYKHSYRWLRFPCCGKAYACDICHDKKEDHDMIYATRMICGHCCREQNFSASRPCSSCGQHLTKIRTAHWEGGSGCRDRVSMSKSDQQKYKNMNKTKSNHQKKLQTGGQKKITKLRHV